MTKNITLSADATLIQRAREQAREQHTSLNAVFRQWLRSYVGESSAKETYERIMAEMKGVSPGRTFSRDELNER